MAVLLAQISVRANCNRIRLEHSGPRAHADAAVLQSESPNLQAPFLGVNRQDALCSAEAWHASGMTGAVGPNTAGSGAPVQVAQPLPPATVEC